MKILKISETKRLQKKFNIPNERARPKKHFKPIIIGLLKSKLRKTLFSIDCS